MNISFKIMKKIFYIIICFIYPFLNFSCKKELAKPIATSSVTVINAAVGVEPLKIKINSVNGFTYAKAGNLSYASSFNYGAFKGNSNITITSSTDTLKTFFSKNLELKRANTLYIVGISPNIDTLFRTESYIPYIPTFNTVSDNSFYLRFVNLSPNSSPVNINIKASTASEISLLSYKQITEFKKYPALATTPNYIFEIRDAVTNSILTTFTLSASTSRFKTLTLVIKGLIKTPVLPIVASKDAIGVFQVNYI